MPVQTHHKTLTVTLSDEDWELLEVFAAEQGISDLNEVVPAMLHELLRLHDLVWDAQLSTVPAPLRAIAQKALEDDNTGLTEDFDSKTS